MRRRAEMSGIFDWFKKLVPPPLPKPTSMLPAVRPEQLPGMPVKEKKSLIDVLRPSKSLIEAPKDIFYEALKPAKKPEPKKEIQWSEIIPAVPQAAAPVYEELTSVLRPATKEYGTRRFVHPDEWPFGEPPLWQNTRWAMPTTMQVMEYIRHRWDLPGMYDYVLSQVESPQWRRLVAESSHYGPAMMDVDLVSAGQNSFFDMAQFLRIPDPIIELYGRQGPEGIERFTVEILRPMLDKVGQALDVFRPGRALPGWFQLEPDEDMNFWVRYKEAKQYPQLGR
jgi:hypothetical protein